MNLPNFVVSRILFILAQLRVVHTMEAAEQVLKSISESSRTSKMNPSSRTHVFVVYTLVPLAFGAQGKLGILQECYHATIALHSVLLVAHIFRDHSRLGKYMVRCLTMCDEVQFLGNDVY
jgi:hypothetical protein